MIGIHLSMTNPLSQVVTAARFSGCETFQIFLRNNRNLRQRKISADEIAEFNSVLLAAGFKKWVIHAPYVMNPSSPETAKRDKAVKIISEDMDFLQQFAGQKYYVLHPGSHMGEGVEFGRAMLLDTLKRVNNTTQTKICLEYMSGGGSLMLSSDSEIRAFHELAKEMNIGYTFDTCHCFASGHVPATSYKYIKDIVDVVHINGSFGMYGYCVDNHSNLHDGHLPFKVNAEFYKQLPKDIPAILETPLSGAYQDLQDLLNY